jgi:transcriptional regulator with XRE-family HTH domain
MVRSSTKDVEIQYQSLRAAVDASKLTQREIARRVGITESYLSHLLKDGRRQPSLSIAMRLSRVLGVDPAALL